MNHDLSAAVVSGLKFARSDTERATVADADVDTDDGCERGRRLRRLLELIRGRLSADDAPVRLTRLSGAAEVDPSRVVVVFASAGAGAGAGEAACGCMKWRTMLR